MTPHDDTNNATPVGRFVVRKKLGSGGMAEVFLAEMTGISGFGKLVALKRLHAHLAKEPSFVAAFIREARLTSCLNHPNIVQTHDLGMMDDTYYMAMEFVDGVNLREFLNLHCQQERALPLSLTLDILKEVSKGLSYAHEASDLRGHRLNMVHRDLKPANVLISHFGSVKISDFGVARADQDWRRTLTARALRGTLGYMSPEQALCQNLDHRSDLFSLGVLAFEMLTLQPIYPLDKGLKRLAAVQEARLEGRLELLNGYPSSLVSLITRLLAKDPAKRPASASLVVQELSSVAASVPVSQLDLGELVRQAQQAELRPVETDASTTVAPPEFLTLRSSRPPPGSLRQPGSTPVRQQLATREDPGEVPTIAQTNWRSILAEPATAPTRNQANDLSWPESPNASEASEWLESLELESTGMTPGIGPSVEERSIVVSGLSELEWSLSSKVLSEVKEELAAQASAEPASPASHEPDPAQAPARAPEPARAPAPAPVHVQAPPRKSTSAVSGPGILQTPATHPTPRSEQGSLSKGNAPAPALAMDRHPPSSSPRRWSGWKLGALLLAAFVASFLLVWMLLS